MYRRILLIIAVLLGVPVVWHSVYSGSYVVDPHGDPRVFWIGPVSTTIPYVALTLLFAAHVLTLSRFRRSFISAYFAGSLAWVCMMGFTLFLISHTHGPQYSSTIGIAIGLTPFFYLPFLVIPYIVGATIGGIFARRGHLEADRGGIRVRERRGRISKVESGLHSTSSVAGPRK